MKPKTDWLALLPAMEYWRKERAATVHAAARFFGVNPQGYYRALERARAKRKLARISSRPKENN